MYKYLLIGICLILACNDETETPILPIENFKIIDHGNTGTTKDLMLKFSQVDQEIQPTEYQLIYSKKSLTENEEMVKNLEEGQKFVIKSGDINYQKAVTKEFLDVEGHSIEEGVAYNFYIVSYNQNTGQVKLSESTVIAIQDTPYYEVQTLGNISGTEALSLSNDAKYVYSPNNNGVSRMSIADGSVERVADDIIFPLGGTFDKSGNFYISSYSTGDIYKIDPSGNKEVYSSGHVGPAGLVFDSEGNLFVANYDGSSIDKVDTDGNRTLFCSSSLLNGPDGVIFADGEMVVINFNDSRIMKINDQGKATFFASLPGQITGYITYTHGSFYAASISLSKVFRIDQSRKVSEIVGSGAVVTLDGPGSWASLEKPNGIVASVTGDTLYVGNSSSIRMIIIHD
ncbi:MAG: hypothetical protein ABJH98_15485 [Reichenbachiella sp.]|uniref:Vgb family protein n=1 Tax=Reichenbachiella sp. TaxID=2184521 RepID=UPI003297D445